MWGGAEESRKLTATGVACWSGHGENLTCRGLNAIKLFLLWLPPFFFFSLWFFSLCKIHRCQRNTKKLTFIRWHNIGSGAKVKELADYSQQNICNERTCRSWTGLVLTSGAAVCFFFFIKWSEKGWAPVTNDTGACPWITCCASQAHIFCYQSESTLPPMSCEQQGSE